MCTNILKKRMLIKCWIPTSSYDDRFVFSTLWNSFWFGNIDKFERTEPSTIMSISLKANNAGCTLWQFNCVKSHHNSSRWYQGHCGYTRMCVVVLLHQPSLQRSVVLHCSNFCATIISYVTISGARSQLIFSDVFLYVMMHLTTLTV